MIGRSRDPVIAGAEVLRIERTAEIGKLQRGDRAQGEWPVLAVALMGSSAHRTLRPLERDVKSVAKGSQPSFDLSYRKAAIGWRADTRVFLGSRSSVKLSVVSRPRNQISLRKNGNGPVRAPALASRVAARFRQRVLRFGAFGWTGRGGQTANESGGRGSPRRQRRGLNVQSRRAFEVTLDGAISTKWFRGGPESFCAIRTGSCRFL